MKKRLLTILTTLIFAANISLAHAVDESENQGLRNDCEKITDSTSRPDKSIYDEKKDEKPRKGSKHTTA